MALHKNIFDSHTHTNNSPDAHHTAAQMVQAAVLAGLRGIAITDHCDCDELERFAYLCHIADSAREVESARALFEGKIWVSFGIELAEVFFAQDIAEKLLLTHNFDFVLGSLHHLEGYEPFFEMDYAPLSAAEIDKMLRRYFKEQLRMVQWGKFDALAHMTVPLRYLKKHRNMDVDLAPYTDEIDTLLRALAENGKGLELNTSGLRGVLGQTMPPLWVLKRFRELGGEIVTLGSDAHYAQHVGAGILLGMHMLTEAGFAYTAFFRGRKPFMAKIE